ncbi:hypothetical protein [Photorhabdus bodei]|uniref:Uncharacterized protein n=1 Tax=Photorhabdus bodei TaxID=2029681 RepID=A0ABX0AY72_9GAMM|nr:hypothetical protein [Photorhabdus bodei]NDL01511.1 hypothetical protein [Photorhabdus bodei]NDL05762.1 hypothetical protein [Photorhabdus bodei]NDL10006.1 hypothetical protein [Photorhabdus bodei]
MFYTLWISRWIATARKRIPGSIGNSIGNYVTGVGECSQQRGNLKDNGYISDSIQPATSRLNIIEELRWR